MNTFSTDDDCFYDDDDDDPPIPEYDKMLSSEYDKINENNPFISIKKLVEKIAVGNNTDNFFVLKELSKILPFCDSAKFNVQLDFKYQNKKYKETIEIAPSDLCIPMCCLAENSYGDIFDDNIECNDIQMKRKVWKYRHIIDNLFIDIPIDEIYVEIDSIKQVLIDNHISLSGRRFPKKMRNTKKNIKINESRYYCIKRAPEIWKTAKQNGDKIIRTGEMAKLLFRELEEKEMWLPSDEIKIELWIKGAARDNDLIKPIESSQSGPSKHN